MIHSDTPGVLLGGLDLLERAVGYTMGSLSLVTTDALGSATPCREWVLGALLGHMSDSFAALCEAAEHGRVDRDGHDDRPDANPVEALRSQARRLLGAWTAEDAGSSASIAGCPLSMSIAACAGAIEVAVHGWDVAWACGRDHPLPPELADDLLQVAPLFITDVDRPVRFATPETVPVGATPSDRLVAFAGRYPGWRAEAVLPPLVQRPGG